MEIEMYDLTKLPRHMLLGEGEMVFVRSFCLGCKEKDVDATKTVHHCGSPITLVHWKYPKSTLLVEETHKLAEEAEKNVNLAMDKLENDPAFLEEYRAKFKGLSFVDGPTL
jgi:hypothetical protein